MAAIFDFFAGSETEATQPPRNNHSSPGHQKTANNHHISNGSQLVTHKDMMDALGKLQAKFEERLNAERKKRVTRLEDMANSLSKRLAEFEESLKHRPGQDPQPPVKGSTSVASVKSGAPPTPADVERLAQSLAQREPRLAAIVGEDRVKEKPYTDVNDEVRSTFSLASNVSDAGRGARSGTSSVSVLNEFRTKAMMIEELKAKVERLEKGSKKLVAAAAEALAGRRTDESLTDDPMAALGNAVLGTTRSSLLSSDSGLRSSGGEAGVLHPRVEALESQMAQVIGKLKSMEDSLDTRIRSTVAMELRGSGYDRPPNMNNR